MDCTYLSTSLCSLFAYLPFRDMGPRERLMQEEGKERSRAAHCTAERQRETESVRRIHLCGISTAASNRQEHIRHWVDGIFS